MVKLSALVNKYPLPAMAWPARLILLLSGALTPLIFAPYNVWPLAYALPIIFWWLTVGQPTREAFLRGWWFGLGFFGTGISWVFFSMRAVDTPIWISLVLTVSFCCAMGLLFSLQAGLPAWVRKRWNFRLPWVVYPLLWLAFEGLRSTLFTGMPWLLWGTLATDNALRGWLPLTGVFGVSLLVLVTAALLWQIRWPRKLTLLAPGLALFFTWGIGVGLLDRVYTTPSTPEPITVAAMQGNIEQATKWNPRMLEPTLRLYEGLNQKHPDADLLVWPETAITAFPNEIRAFLDALNAQLLDANQTLISGLILRDEDDVGPTGDFYNGLRAWGTTQGEYRKQHLVPFGEYLPLQGLLQGLIAFFDLPMSGFSPGDSNQEPLLMNVQNQTIRLAALICYEAAYPGMSRQQATDSDLLVVISNDAWFGRSIAPHQHLQITRARSIENQRAMVRSTQNGISAVVDEHGRILAQSEQFVIDSVSASVQPLRGQTPYQRFGEWPTLLFAALLLLLGWVGSRLTFKQ